MTYGDKTSIIKHHILKHHSLELPKVMFTPSPPIKSFPIKSLSQTFWETPYQILRT